MDSKEVAEYWNKNAEAWTVMSRKGYDTRRNHLNTPAFFEILPDINGSKGIDIGCGEGYNTRLLADKGAEIFAIDICDVFLKKAIDEETKEPKKINYLKADAHQIPFDDCSFDFATAFMSLMDMPEPEKAVKEIYRVLKPGGFFQFSIMHPCFPNPVKKILKNPDGSTYEAEVVDYFNSPDSYVVEWTFGTAPPELRDSFPKFKIPLFVRTLSQWINMLIQAGFQIEQLNEPFPSDEIVKQYPNLQDAQVVAYFLQVRCRKS